MIPTPESPISQTRHGGVGGVSAGMGIIQSIQKEKRLLFTAITIAKFISLNLIFSSQILIIKNEPLHQKI